MKIVQLVNGVFEFWVLKNLSLSGWVWVWQWFLYKIEKGIKTIQGNVKDKLDKR